MFAKLSKNSFIRSYKNIGYITNQLTKLDQVYDETGMHFLNAISRTPKLINDIVDKLYSQYADFTISSKEVKEDFVTFIKNLELDGFVTIGETIEQVKLKDNTFTYLDYSPKTISLQFIQKNKISTTEETADYLYDYFQQHPMIFGMHLEITSRCNEKCIHCYQTQENHHTMDLSLAKNLMDQLYEMGTISLTFSGGEPFLHPHFTEILKYARERDFIINILTNGTRISKDLIEVIKEININNLQVSLYSMDASIHDLITQVPGSHKLTMKTIELLLEADIPIQISCPVMKANKNSYKKISKWCHKHKIRVLSDFVMMAKSDFDCSNLANRLSISETEELINDIINVEEEYQTLLELESKSGDMEQYKNMPVCGVGIDNACVTADGELYPCSGFSGYSLGNANKVRLSTIWSKSDKLSKLRNIKNKSFPSCLNCEARDYCAMCLVRNYNESAGDMFKINRHYCEVAFLNKSLVEKYKKQNINYE